MLAFDVLLIQKFLKKKENGININKSSSSTCLKPHFDNKANDDLSENDSHSTQDQGCQVCCFTSFL